VKILYWKKDMNIVVYKALFEQQHRLREMLEAQLNYEYCYQDSDIETDKVKLLRREINDLVSHIQFNIRVECLDNSL